MNKIFFLLGVMWVGHLQADSTTFSKDRIEAFYSEFSCEEKQDLSSAGLTSPCLITPTPPGPPPLPPGPPPPPADPIPPAPVTGYFPLVISNQTGQPDSDVYIIGLYNNNSQFLTLSGATFPGQMSTFTANVNTFSASPLFSYPLTALPKSTTGANQYLIYLPPVSSGGNGRIYFSIGSPMYLLTQPGAITAPSGTTFNDPNYNVLWDFAEVFYQGTSPVCSGCIDWTATLDTTQVDSFALPIELAFYSYPSLSLFIPAGSNTSPAGFSLDRDTILAHLVAGLTSPWNGLLLPFRTDPYAPSAPSTYLRVIAPKDGGPLAQPKANYTLPTFPADYISNAAYGINYLDTLFTYYAGAPFLYIEADVASGGSGQIYKGSASGTYPNAVFTFTSTTVPANIVTLNQSDILLNQLGTMYSGNPPMTGTGSTPGADLGLLKNYFGSAFIVGLLGHSPLYETDLTALNGKNRFSLTATLTSHLPTTPQVATPKYYTSTTSPFSPGIWYDLYASLLHADAIKPISPPTIAPPLPDVGLCYAYDFDDTLGMSSAIAPPATTPLSDNVYGVFTLNDAGTLPTTVFDDPNTYDLTLYFTGTLQYRQGTSGNFIDAQSGVVVSHATTTSANPFQVLHNGNIYNLFPKYQFLQPQGQFTTAQSAEINATTFTPNNASAPTGFTISFP